MENPYTIIALLTTGVALSMGAISLFIGFHNKEKANLIFGFMAMALAIFFLLPPVGFILDDNPPYPAHILFKRAFIFSYYALIPWFVLFYTGYRSKIIPYFILIESVITYGIMFTATEDMNKPLWSQIAIIPFATIFFHGLWAGIRQYRNGGRQKARWLILSMLIFGFLFMATAINQLSDNFLGYHLNMELFFPIHLHSILFMMIMGMVVVVTVFEKYRLEKVIKARDKRWSSFMLHAPVVVVELNKAGEVIYVNDFGVDLLGYRSPGELQGKNWFDSFLPETEAVKQKQQYAKLLSDEKSMPFSSNILRVGHNNITISWVNFITYSDDGEVFGVMSVGRDLSVEVSTSQLINQLKLELEKERIDVSVVGEVDSLEIIGTSKPISYAIQKARQVATTDAPVLLEGETGVGKELFAELIHKTSTRNAMPIVKVNCGALPKELIEDELFGHERGAFTSAIQARKGRFELADGGTLFLDEIGELPLEMQPKLLRVLQNGEFVRIGGQKTIKVDVRVIAATNRDLSSAVEEGSFRSDLFYRLDVFPITIPPLRKRKEDLPALIQYFISGYSRKYGKKLDQVSKADMQRLSDYAWPGNVRELMNVIERSVIASGSTTLTVKFNDRPDSETAVTLEQIEREHILKIMDGCNWKINGENGAAEKLNMHPNTLRSKMKKLGIYRPAKDTSKPSMADSGLEG